MVTYLLLELPVSKNVISSNFRDDACSTNNFIFEICLGAHFHSCLWTLYGVFYLLTIFIAWTHCVQKCIGNDKAVGQCPLDQTNGSIVRKYVEVHLAVFSQHLI